MASIIVELNSDSLATYQGGIPGLPATSPSKTGAKKLNVSTSDSKAYLGYLNTKHQKFIQAASKQIPQGKVTHTVFSKSLEIP